MNKIIRRLTMSVLLFGSFLITLPVEAYIGLCCGKCGGNMCMNILGAGVPETHEFRFKVTPMFMKMSGMREGTKDVSNNDLLSLPTNFYSPLHSRMMHGGHSGMMKPMQMPNDRSIMIDNIAGATTGRKYMAVPTAMEMDMLNLAAGYSFTDNFFAGIMFMAKSNRMDMQFNNMMQVMTGRSGYTMKSKGMADTMVISKYRLYTDDALIPRSQVSLVAGVSLPTGSINMKNRSHPLGKNPYTGLAPYLHNNINYPRVTMNVPGSTMKMSMPIPDRTDELLPYSMQLGSGTYDPILGLVYSGSTSPVWWGVNMIYKGRWYRNKQGYALGDEVDVDIYAMYQLTESLVGHVQLNGHAQGDIQGEMEEAREGRSGRIAKNNRFSGYMTPMFDPKNYGGESVNASIGLQWQPVPLQILDFTYSAPIYERVNGTQLSQEYKVQLAWYIEITTSASRRDPAYKNRKQKSKIGF